MISARLSQARAVRVADISFPGLTSGAEQFRCGHHHGKMGKIDVRSAGSGCASLRGHYPVPMFGGASTDGSIEGDRLADIETQLQPIPDCLASNHRNFLRLNEFSEAFSI